MDECEQRNRFFHFVALQVSNEMPASGYTDLGDFLSCLLYIIFANIGRPGDKDRMDQFWSFRFGRTDDGDIFGTAATASGGGCHLFTHPSVIGSGVDHES